MNMAEGITLGILAGLSLYDIKRKRVPVAVLIAAAVLALVYRFCSGSKTVELLAGLVPGFALLAAAFCTKESIGIGDGLVLGVLGVFCGIRKILAILGIALTASALLAIVLLVLKRAGRKTELPFLPCLCVGYVVCFLW